MKTYIKHLLSICLLSLITTLGVAACSSPATSDQENELVLVLHFYPKEGQVNAFKKELNKLLNKLSKQSSFVSVTFHEDLNTPGSIILYEVWKEESQEEFMKKTNANPDFKTYQEKVKSMFVKPPDVYFMKAYKSL